MPASSYPFGQLHQATVERWLRLDPEDDSPVWMLNLMKYREVADYGDRRPGTISGRQADDAYAPLGPLAAVGAEVSLFADVTNQLAGQPTWDRVAVVRYPSRSAFFAMQQRRDFKEAFPHKKAGLAFTIIAGCVPELPLPTNPPPQETVRVLSLRRRAPGSAPSMAPPGVTSLARFIVDGVVVGGPEHYDELAYDAVAPGTEHITDDPGVLDQHVVVLKASIDRLLLSLQPESR